MSTRRHRRALARDLRVAIDCLPAHTRVAMLEGVRSHDIIVGAYVDRKGGVCPMLAAHRCGGRTDFLTFARTWDSFTGARGRARRASQRELAILIAHLEASLLADQSVDLAGAIAEHRQLVASDRSDRGAQRDARVDLWTSLPGDTERSSQLRRRPGWAWLRPFRRLDDYERALARVQSEHETLEAEATESSRPRETAGV